MIVSAAAMIMLAVISFVLLHFMPGGPFSSDQASPEIVRALEKTYGLDRPLPVQMAVYMGGLLHGNFGVSYKEAGVSVASVIGRSAPLTLSLGAVSVIAAFLIGTAAAVAEAFFSWRRKTAFLIFYGLASGVPGFAAALLLLLAFGIKIPVFPVTGLYTPLHYVLPVLSLCLYPASVCARILSAAMKKESQKEYVVQLRAAGVSEGRILFCHLLKNGWVPVLGYLSQAVAYLLTGSFAVEAIFNIPGLGREFVGSIMNRDYTVVMGLVIYTGVIVIGAGLVIDLFSALIDPHVRRSLTRSRE